MGHMRRILILSASIGLGHYRAGQALAHAFEPIDSVEVLHEDALKYANAVFRNLYAKSYADLVDKAPELLGWLYERSDAVWDEVKHGIAFQRLNAMPLVKLVQDYAPDVVACTHALPADDLLAYLPGFYQSTCYYRHRFRYTFGLALPSLLSILRRAGRDTRTSDSVGFL